MLSVVVNKKTSDSWLLTSQWPSWRLISPGLNSLFTRLFKLTSKKKTKPTLLALCKGNPPVAGGFPSQRASNAKNVSREWHFQGVRHCQTGAVWAIYIMYMELWGSWWRHQMETFSALLALCAGNSPVTAEFPSQRPVTRSFDVFFDLRLNKRLSEQSRREASDLRRHRAHYEVTVMYLV